MYISKECVGVPEEPGFGRYKGGSTTPDGTEFLPSNTDINVHFKNSMSLAPIRFLRPLLNMTTNGIVASKLVYSLPPADGTRAFVNINANPDGKRDTNVSRFTADVKIENVRGKEDLYTLDNSGLQFCARPTKFKDFQDNKRIEEEYYPECIEFVKEATGAQRVVIFDHSKILPLSPNAILTKVESAR